MTTATAPVATFARLQDQTWGLRVNGPRPTPGTSITVSKRDGGTKTVTVGAVLWHGTARDGQIASLCSIAGDSTRSGGRDSAGNLTRNGDSYRAGVRAPHRRTCPNCGSRECAKAWNPRDLCDED